MRKLILSLAAVMLGVLPAAAFGRRCHGGAVQSVPAASFAPTSPQTGGVQWKADVQAASGRMHHTGGGFVPGAGFEGVGYSSLSPADALARCCDNGGPVVAQAVSAGPGGWYAVKQYGQPGPVRQAVGGAVVQLGGAVQGVGGMIQHGTSYAPPTTGLGGTPYTPIRLGSPLPTCVNGQCGR